MKTADITIRPETAADTVAIHALTARAFAGKSYSDGNEQDLIDALRYAGALTVSLVAEHGGQIIGHVALSPAFAQDGSPGWFALGPVSVDPLWQRQGVGGRLIQESMARLMALNAAGCVVLGDTGYYPRHGFVPRPELAPPSEPAQHYMTRPLRDAIPETQVSFHPILSATGPTP